MSRPQPHFSASAYPHPHDDGIIFTRNPSDLTKLGFLTGQFVKAVILMLPPDVANREAVEIRNAFTAYNSGDLSEYDFVCKARKQLFEYLPKEWITLSTEYDINIRIGKKNAPANFHTDGAARGGKLRVLRTLQGDSTQFFAGILPENKTKTAQNRSYPISYLQEYGIVDVLPANCIAAFLSRLDNIDSSKSFIHSAPLPHEGRIVAVYNKREFAIR